MQEAERILADALRLPTEARASLAGRLLQSLDEQEPDEGVEAAWDDESQQRMAAIDNGTMKLMPWSDVRRQLLERRNH
jgi:putative addiction module component (TIGR02574 family)